MVHTIKTMKVITCKAPLAHLLACCWQGGGGAGTSETSAGLCADECSCAASCHRCCARLQGQYGAGVGGNHVRGCGVGVGGVYGGDEGRGGGGGGGFIVRGHICVVKALRYMISKWCSVGSWIRLNYIMLWGSFRPSVWMCECFRRPMHACLAYICELQWGLYWAALWLPWAPALLSWGCWVDSSCRCSATCLHCPCCCCHQAQPIRISGSYNCTPHTVGRA